MITLALKDAHAVHVAAKACIESMLPTDDEWVMTFSQTVKRRSKRPLRFTGCNLEQGRYSFVFSDGDWTCYGNMAGPMDMAQEDYRALYQLLEANAASRYMENLSNRPIQSDAVRDTLSKAATVINSALQKAGEHARRIGVLKEQIIDIDEEIESLRRQRKEVEELIGEMQKEYEADRAVAEALAFAEKMKEG
jgi:arsenate reductase-like glutaredoxin family protein